MSKNLVIGDVVRLKSHPEPMLTVTHVNYQTSQCQVAWFDKDFKLHHSHFPQYCLEKKEE